jgi:hypothetical protein
MPTKKVIKVTKASKAKGTFAKENNAIGVVLKAAFPNLDDEGRKVLRRRMRAAIRQSTAEGKVLAAHRLGSRWIVSPAMRKAATSLNG